MTSRAINDNLVKAVSKGQFDKVRQLIDSGADVNYVHNGENRVILYAIQNHHLDIVKYLIECGADISVDDVPLSWAVDKNTKCSRGRTGHVCSDQKIAMVKFLIEQGHDVNRVFELDESPLFNAASMGCIDVVKILVENGANVNWVCHGDGLTVLMIAAAKGRLEVVKYLVEHGADVCAKDKHGLSALVHARHYDHSSVESYLRKTEEMNKK